MIKPRSNYGTFSLVDMLEKIGRFEVSPSKDVSLATAAVRVFGSGQMVTEESSSAAYTKMAESGPTYQKSNLDNRDAIQKAKDQVLGLFGKSSDDTLDTQIIGGDAIGLPGMKFVYNKWSSSITVSSFSTSVQSPLFSMLGIASRTEEIAGNFWTRGDLKIGTQRDLDAILHNVSRFVSGRLPGYGSIGSLSSVLNDESYQEVADAIDLDLTSLQEMDVISFNRVYEASDRESGDCLVIKVSGNEQKARIEAAANYFLSQHERLEGIITKGFFPEPIKFGDVYVTVQKKVEDPLAFDAHYYMSALALLHSYGSEAATQMGVLVPTMKVKEFADILDDVGRRDSTYLLRQLQGKYEEAAAEIMECLDPVVLHGDAKQANLQRGRLLDLENLQMGHPAVDIALYLSCSGIVQEEWTRYVQTYLDVRSQETKMDYAPEDLVNLTKQVTRLAVVPAMKELGGLYSRAMGPDEREQAARLQQVLI